MPPKLLKPVSQVLLNLATPLQEEIITPSGLKLYLDGTYNKNYTATVTAKIAELPLNYRDKKLKEGDEVCISYQVVYDMDYGSDGKRFMPTTEGNDYFREFVNGRGEKIGLYALPKRSGLSKAEWVGVYQDKFRNVVDGTQGHQSKVETWLAQFPIGKTDDYRFNNFFEFGKHDYWKCDISEIFAKRENGHLIAVSDRVICKPYEEDAPQEVIQQVKHANSVKIRYQDRGIVLSSPVKEYKKEQIVSFNPEKVEKYSFYGRDYYLIRHDLINGIWKK